MQLNIGNKKISGWAALAPMAGVADRAFRELCICHGAAVTFGELASAKGIVLGDAHSAFYLECFEPERPFGSQLFGSEPETMAKAALKALEFKPDFIDINMGCPAPKVAISSKGGSALLKDPILAGEIVKAVKSVAGDTPVTVKMRTGWDENSIVAPRLAEICELNGADAITVHGRTRKQMYAPPCDLETIKNVKNSVSVPVIANGDITDGPSAMNMYEKTDCDFVMVGRAAEGNPWVFEKINAYMEKGVILPDVTLDERLETLVLQTKKMIEYKGERTAFLECRKHAAWYLKGFRGAAALRTECGKITSMQGLLDLCRLACELNKGE